MNKSAGPSNIGVTDVTKHTHSLLPIGLGKVLISAALALSGSFAAADIAFTNIAENPANQLRFERARSDSYATLLEALEDSVLNPVSFEQVSAETPHRTGGFPGVALVDIDGDDDIDIYVTNGPGYANGLFVNQLSETGKFSFSDESASSGAQASDLDSNGVCFGDLDNDGDDDLYVLGRESENRLFENLGGTFSEVFAHGAEAGVLSHISCSMGDIDNDGLLDVVVSNAFSLDNALPLGGVAYDLNHHNQLFKNVGGLSFDDVSETSGILAMDLDNAPSLNPPTISWAVSMVDIDQDGDTDILFGDDQAALPNAGRGGFDRGYVQVFLNDGTGYFSNQPVFNNDYSASAWMGLGFGDFNCDDQMDVFASNIGAYMFPAFGMPTDLGSEATRALYGNGDGTFNDPPTLDATVFGWGNAVADLDNDGDQDVVYHGAMDLNAFVAHDNPGIVLENDRCSGRFSLNTSAFRGDYSTRGTQGVAVGDLDRDGYVDVVTVSNHRMDPATPFFLGPPRSGSPLDDTARIYTPMLPDPSTGLLSWGGIELLKGDMTVEINAGGHNRSVSIELLGTAGLLPKGRSNRSGLGAVARFKPRHGQPVTVPLVGGSSFTSQHARDAHFGLGDARSGILDVLWPGGTRNRLYGVRADERLTIPEIPCSITAKVSLSRHVACVRTALRVLYREDVITKRLRGRLFASAVRAFLAERRDARARGER